MRSTAGCSGSRLSVRQLGRRVGAVVLLKPLFNGQFWVGHGATEVRTVAAQCVHGARKHCSVYGGCEHQRASSEANACGAPEGVSLGGQLELCGTSISTRRARMASRKALTHTLDVKPIPDISRSSSTRSSRLQPARNWAAWIADAQPFVSENCT